MFYVQIVVVDESGEQQNDADVESFETIEEAYQAQARACEALTLTGDSLDCICHMNPCDCRGQNGH